MEKYIEIILNAIDDKRGRDSVTIKLANAFADAFVITTGGSPAQTQAIADEVERQMEKIGRFVIGKEGYREGNWILLDYGDILVHVFMPEQRVYYHIEKLWQ